MTRGLASKKFSGSPRAQGLKIIRFPKIKNIRINPTESLVAKKGKKEIFLKFEFTPRELLEPEVCKKSKCTMAMAATIKGIRK